MRCLNEYAANPESPTLQRGEDAAEELKGSNRVRGLFPHEVFFGLFLLVTWARLGVVVGWLVLMP